MVSLPRLISFLWEGVRRLGRHWQGIYFDILCWPREASAEMELVMKVIGRKIRMAHYDCNRLLALAQGGR